MNTINDLIRNIATGASAAHAYVIEDERADARAEFIETLAQGLECTADDIAERPCGRCAACRQVKAGSSLDIVRMQMSGKTAYKVKEDAEPFIERLDMGAYGKHLIGIIDDASCLSDVVQNKLLKTLEEPRESVVLLIGVANSEQLLDTVRSRVSILRAASFEGFENTGEGKGSEDVRNAASLMLSTDSAFYEARAAIEKIAKTKSDALLLIDAAEDLAEAMMRSEGRYEAAADVLEYCERARMDIETGMDKNKALKRLRLEIQEAQA